MSVIKSTHNPGKANIYEVHYMISNYKDFNWCDADSAEEAIAIMGKELKNWIESDLEIQAYGSEFQITKVEKLEDNFTAWLRRKD